MKLKILSYGVILTVFMCAMGYAAEAPKVQPPKKQTGADWLLMTPQEKVECISNTVAFLRSKGLPINKTPDFYGSQLNSVVDQPGADKADIVNLVMTLAYKSESQTRPYIDQMRTKPGVKKPASTPKRQSI